MSLSRLVSPISCVANQCSVSTSSKEVALLGGTFLLSDIRKMAHYKFCFYRCYRKLAANFDNARGKEEIKMMSDESLPGLDTNTSEENESPYTVNKR